MNAIRLLGAIPSLNQNLHMFFWVGWWSDVYEQVIARVREMATDETWEKAFAEGGTLSMQQAMAIALQELQRQSLRGELRCGTPWRRPPGSAGVKGSCVIDLATPYAPIKLIFI